MTEIHHTESARPLLSVVVPCFNEEAVIQETAKCLQAELQKISIQHGMRFEIIYVDDGSRDQTLNLLNTIANTSSQTKVIALSRNFGHQVALSAGLDHAEGDAVVAIDADLQDPIEVIGEMVTKWKAGAEVVFGVRKSRVGESWFKLVTAKGFYRVLRRLTGVEIPVDAGDFRLMDRAVVQIFKSMNESSRFIRGMVPWIGFKQEPVYYERAARFAGTTKYSFRRMISLAFDAVTSFSSAPLRAAYIAGFWVAGISFLWASYIFIRTLFFDHPAVGWSSVMVTVLFLGGVQLITVGILGEYIGRIYDQVKGRPLYIVNRKKCHGLTAPEHS